MGLLQQQLSKGHGVDIPWIGMGGLGAERCVGSKTVRGESCALADGLAVRTAVLKLMIIARHSPAHLQILACSPDREALQPYFKLFQTLTRCGPGSGDGQDIHRTGCTRRGLRMKT